MRHLLNKFRKQKCPSHVVLKNQLPKDIKKYVIGTISFCSFKGHDAYWLDFILKDFMKQTGDYIGKIIGLTINI